MKKGRRYRGLMSTIQYNICGDGYDADERARLIFEKAQRRIDRASEKGRADERAKVLKYLVTNGYIKYGFNEEYLEEQLTK